MWFYYWLQEVRDDPIVMAKMNDQGLLWDELSPVKIDYQKLEHLFESRAKDLITKVYNLIFPFLFKKFFLPI